MEEQGMKPGVRANRQISARAGTSNSRQVCARAGDQQRTQAQRAGISGRPEDSERRGGQDSDRLGGQNSDRWNGQKREVQQRVIQNVSIGRNLRRLRRQRDLTQDQVASKLQVMGLPVTRGIYAQIETGAHHIPITWLMGLKRIFRTTYDEMLETEETMAFLRELE